MAFIRSQAISAINESTDPIDPVDQVVLAITHKVPEWLPVAYASLCSRKKPLTGDEAERLGARTVALIAEMREKRLMEARVVSDLGDAKVASEPQSTRTVPYQHPGQQFPPKMYQVPGTLPTPILSTLSTACVIHDISQILYPEGIMIPKVELNIGAKNGKFR